MEVDTATGIRARGAIFQIALDVASHRMKLRPDLMVPSGLQPNLQQVVSVQAKQKMIA
jgi:hypothetical protein